MDVMHVTAGPDDDGRRLDSIIRRFLRETSLSQVYGAVRKGLIKVDGKKCKPETRVRAGSDIAIASFLVEQHNPPIAGVAPQMAPIAGAAPQMNTDVIPVLDTGISDTKIIGSSPIMTGTMAIQPVQKRIDDNLILFRNDDVLILNKPYDLSVQKARRGDVSLADMVAADYAVRKEKHASLSFRPGPLHRLDRKTTGIIVFSQSLRGAQWFSHALQTHAVRKTYLALLQGNLESPATWEDFLTGEKKVTTDAPVREHKCQSFPLGKRSAATYYTDDTDYRNGKKQNLCKSVSSVDNKKNMTPPPAFFHTVAVIGASPTMTDGRGKYAHTTASPIAYGSYHGSPVTLARVEIGTGRKHQIRAQAAAHGFPLLGDTAYGGRAICEAQDFFLHAYRLAIGENPLGIPPEIKADISTNFAKMLSICLINFDARL